MKKFASTYYSRADLIDDIMEDRENRLSEQITDDPERLVLLAIAHARGDGDARASISTLIERHAEDLANYMIANEDFMASEEVIARNAKANAADAQNDEEHLK